MSDKEEYGIEDICESLDGIEKEIRRLIKLLANHFEKDVPII